MYDSVSFIDGEDSLERKLLNSFYNYMYVIKLFLFKGLRIFFLELDFGVLFFILVDSNVFFLFDYIVEF